MKKPFISLELFKSKRIDMRNEHYHPDGQKVHEHYQSDGQKVHVSTLKFQKSKYQSKKLSLTTKTINLWKKPIIFLELAKRKRVDMRNKLYQSDGQKNHEHYQADGQKVHVFTLKFQKSK